MNLYFRLFWTWFCARFNKPIIQMGDTIELALRVWPTDLDVNGHMNNGRYMTILDLALVEYMTRAGFLSVAMKKGWKPVLGGSMISFRKSLKPFGRYRLTFRVMCWDERWSYMGFEFWCGETLVASGQSKGAIIGKQGQIASKDAFSILVNTPISPPIPDSVYAWLEAERLMHLQPK